MISFKIGVTLFLLAILTSCGKHTKTVYVQGTQGPAGEQGQACHAESVTGGVNVICGDSANFIPNGTNGQDGKDGAFTGRIELVEVCPDIKPQSYMETILELDGEFMAYLAASQWNKQRLVKLEAGVTYQTTDGRNVQFQIDNGQVICL